MSRGSLAGRFPPGVTEMMPSCRLLINAPGNNRSLPSRSSQDLRKGKGFQRRPRCKGARNNVFPSFPSPKVDGLWRGSWGIQPALRPVGLIPFLSHCTCLTIAGCVLGVYWVCATPPVRPQVWNWMEPVATRGPCCFFRDGSWNLCLPVPCQCL